LASLHFQILDRTTGLTFSPRRAGDQLYLLDEANTQLVAVALLAGVDDEEPRAAQVPSGS
jgi:hypothetical protein